MVKYKQKGINRKGSPAFNALDALHECLENSGAKATFWYGILQVTAQEEKNVIDFIKHY